MCYYTGETQRAWMVYADSESVPHDHEDEDVFKQGFIAGQQAVAARATTIDLLIDEITKRVADEMRKEAERQEAFRCPMCGALIVKK